MNRQLPPGRTGGILDVFTRVVAIVATALLLVASLFVGAFVALTLLGLVAIIWLVFAIRWWQLKRRWRAAQTRRDSAASDDSGSTTVDGDFRVVRDDEDRPRG